MYSSSSRLLIAKLRSLLITMPQNSPRQIFTRFPVLPSFNNCEVIQKKSKVVLVLPKKICRLENSSYTVVKDPINPVSKRVFVLEVGKMLGKVHN